ncbi:uncharacterized protein K444DRAFT_648506 [Hyaloscypha bicolor E]|uniref:General substrate transporter n=1 Tax=Hyaloscypha bicolor E TaxID=1095630 RepID=A0A2J6SIW5_9HELO|nr:uncharacterized protein K444DRAFT_648506 [Hyaloscypha bicolor E]PMD50705.1 hypothetical protein K444DRAFT_648506 [Hyaloscypha bicolor E]
MFRVERRMVDLWATVPCATDMVLFGYDQGTFGDIIVMQDVLDTLKLKGNTSMIGTMTALYVIGGLFGAIIAVMVGALPGQKKTILIGTSIGAVGAIMHIKQHSFNCPTLAVRGLKASWRGNLVVIVMILNIAEFSLSNWVTYGFSFVGGFHLMEIPACVPIHLHLRSPRNCSLAPESPPSRKILADLEGLDAKGGHVTNDVKEIEFTGDLLRGRTRDQGGTSTIRRLVLGMGTQIMQQLSVSYLLFSLVAIPNIERWGRRNPIMYAAGQALCCVFVTVLITYSELEGYQYQEQVASASVPFFLYYIFFGIGWQGVPWQYPNEINSASMRTKASALGTAGDWIFKSIVTVFDASSVPIVYLFYLETSDSTLEDIDRLFRENGDILIFRDKNAIAIATERTAAYF